jgi:hypothetical protein
MNRSADSEINTFIGSGRHVSQTRKPIDIETGELSWHDIKTQYAAFAVAKA